MRNTRANVLSCVDGSESSVHPSVACSSIAVEEIDIGGLPTAKIKMPGAQSGSHFPSLLSSLSNPDRVQSRFAVRHHIRLFDGLAVSVPILRRPVVVGHDTVTIQQFAVVGGAVDRLNLKQREFG